jgi:hypothetical protein
MALFPGGKVQHAQVAVLERAVGKHLVVAGDFASLFERRCPERFGLGAHDAVEKVEIGRDPPRARVFAVGGDGIEGQTALTAVVLTHLFEEQVVDEGDDGGYAVAGHLDG